MLTAIKRAGIGVYMIVVLMAASMFIGWASEAGLLIALALPFAAVLILALRVFGPRAELAGWMLFTVWLGSTYLTTGTKPEIAVFFVFLGLAVLGGFVSPYFLAAAWLLHPLWDLVPRDLPAILKDLPTACLMFDLLIGLYLLWGARTKRWMPFGRRTAPESPPVAPTQPSLFRKRAVLLAGCALGVVAAIALGHLILAPPAGFTGAREEASARVEQGKQTLRVQVRDGVFSPNVAVLAAGTPATLEFGPSSGCTSQVRSSDLDFQLDLTSSERSVALPALSPGTYRYSCAMRMTHGMVVVR